MTENTEIDSNVMQKSVLRLSVTSACNLRCRYCVPENKNIHEDELYGKIRLPDFETMIKASKFIIENFGVDKVRITGGEPLLRNDINLIISALKKIDGVKEVAITTNGQLLEKKAKLIVEAGICGVNVSLDTLDASKYCEITGGGSILNVLNGIEAVKKAGVQKIKTNFVVMKGVNDDEIKQMVQFAIEKNIEVRFLELMPFDGCAGVWEKCFFSKDAILKVISSSFDIYPIHSRREQTAEMFMVREKRGNKTKGVIGVIGSLDGKMCRTCNRIRITADGMLKRCLKDSNEIDLYSMVRNQWNFKNIKEIVDCYLKLKTKPTPYDGKGNMMRIGG